MTGWEVLGTVVGVALTLSIVFYDPLSDDSWWKEVGDDADKDMFE